MFASLLLLPLLSFFIIILFGRFIPVRWALALNIFSLFTAILYALLLLNDVIILNSTVLINLATWIQLGTFKVTWQLLFDPLSLIMTLLVLVISTFVHLYSWDYMGQDPHFLRFMAYLSIFTFFMLLFVTAGNFFQMFVGWEGVGLASYLLINFWYTRLQANKSAMKAIIVNRISDLFLYFSLFLIFFAFGTLEYNTIFYVFLTSHLNSVWLHSITFCILIGAVGKSAQLGLHTWLPDAMEGPTPVSALLHAATMVTAGVFLLVRTSFLFEHTPAILLLVAFFGGLTTFIAGTIGSFQNDIKKVIAYSTCSQLGYMFLIAGLGYFNVAFFHLFNHAFFKALLFLGAGSVIHALFDEQDIRKMGGLFRTLPITYTSFLLGSLALAGIPYLTGFYSKDLLLELTFSTFSVSSTFFYWLAICSVFFTAFYSTRLAYYVFLGWPSYNSFKVAESSYVTLAVLLSLSVASIFIGFLGKELFVGVGIDSWQNCLNILVLNTFVETELAFIFGGTLAANKLFPLALTFVGMFVSVLLLSTWVRVVQLKTFRTIYEFINQKWYFDVIYFNFIVTPLIRFGYFLSFKLIDRGILEAVGSISLVHFLNNITLTVTRLFESGQLYAYLAIQLFFIIITLF